MKNKQTRGEKNEREIFLKCQPVVPTFLIENIPQQFAQTWYFQNHFSHGKTKKDHLTTKEETEEGEKKEISCQEGEEMPGGRRDATRVSWKSS